MHGIGKARARCAVHLVGGISNNRLFKEEMYT